jgi:hypothetical protein
MMLAVFQNLAKGPFEAPKHVDHIRYTNLFHNTRCHVRQRDGLIALAHIYAKSELYVGGHIQVIVNVHTFEHVLNEHRTFCNVFIDVELFVVGRDEENHCGWKEGDDKTVRREITDNPVGANVTGVTLLLADLNMISRIHGLTRRALVQCPGKFI